MIYVDRIKKNDNKPLGLNPAAKSEKSSETTAKKKTTKKA